MFHLGNFVDLTQSGFLVIPETTFANFCKPVHQVIIIALLSDPLNLENVERKGKITIN